MKHFVHIIAFIHELGKNVMPLLSLRHCLNLTGFIGLKVLNVMTLADCNVEHEYDWFTHLHQTMGKKGDSTQQLFRRVHNHLSYLDLQGLPKHHLIFCPAIFNQLENPVFSLGDPASVHLYHSCIFSCL